MQTVELIERRHFVKRQQDMRKSKLKLFDCPRQDSAAGQAER
jgi:hypothetical protein